MPRKYIVAVLALTAWANVAGLSDLVFEETGGSGGGGAGAGATTSSAGGTGGGCAADTNADPLNCGACGVVCSDAPSATPACVDGGCAIRCDPGFEDCDLDAGNGCEADEATCNTLLLVSGKTPYESVVVDGMVYFIADEAIWSCPRTGCDNAPTKLADRGNTVRYLVHSGDELFWNANNSNEIWKCPVSGCLGSEVLVASAPDPTHLAVDDTHVYWQSQNSDVARSLRANGSTVEVLHAGISGNSPLRRAGSEVIYSSEGDDVVYRCDVNNCEPQPAVMIAQPFGLWVDTNNIYVGTRRAGADEVVQASRVGGGTIVLSSREDDVYDIRGNATHVYWAEDASDGRVRKAPIGGGVAPETIGVFARPRSIALDDAFIYVSDVVANELWRYRL